MKKQFDLTAWAQLATGTPAGGMQRVRPSPPGPTAEEITQPIVKWIQASTDYNRPDNPPAWATDAAGWQRSRLLLADQWTQYVEPYAAVLAIYISSGGRIIFR